MSYRMLSGHGSPTTGHAPGNIITSTVVMMFMDRGPQLRLVGGSGSTGWEEGSNLGLDLSIDLRLLLKEILKGVVLVQGGVDAEGGRHGGEW